MNSGSSTFSIEQVAKIYCTSSNVVYRVSACLVKSAISSTGQKVG